MFIVLESLDSRCATIEEIEAEKSSIEKDAKARMEKTIETVRTNFNSIRTGRVNPAMLDKVVVEYNGTPVNLKNIAQISTPGSSSLLIQPFGKSRYGTNKPDLINISSDLSLVHVVFFSHLLPYIWHTL